MKCASRRLLTILLAVLLVASCFTIPIFAKPIEGVSRKASASPGKDGAVPYAELRTADQSGLPQKVNLRDAAQSYNLFYEIALKDGVLYVRKRNSGDPWKVAPCPEALKGKITGISMDGDEIVALDKDNWIYNCFSCDKDTDQWNWGTAWGGVGRLGDSYQIGNGAPGKWALSITTVKYDKTYKDIDQKEHPVSFAGCTQLVFVDKDDPTLVICNDPWLPRDHSYTYGSPKHGRFKVNTLSASASTVLVMNKYGDMFTRRKDYDLSGGDPAQFRYSWLDQDGKQPAENYLQHRLDPNTAAIRLPSPGWEQQPKIPGTITDRISIESTGSGNDSRLLKVEGEKNGKTGYWQKMLKDTSWTFVPTGEKLKGNKVENPQKDTSDQDLAPETGIEFEGNLDEYSAELEVEDFAYDDSVQYAELEMDGVKIHPTLYTEYGNLGRAATQELFPRNVDGLAESEPRRYVAALVLSDEDVQKLSQTEHGKAFLQDFMGGRKIRPLSISVTSKEMTIYLDTDNNTPVVGQSYVLHRDYD